MFLSNILNLWAWRFKSRIALGTIILLKYSTGNSVRIRLSIISEDKTKCETTLNAL